MYFLGFLYQLKFIGICRVTKLIFPMHYWEDIIKNKYLSWNDKGYWYMGIIFFRKTKKSSCTVRSVYLDVI